MNRNRTFIACVIVMVLFLFPAAQAIEIITRTDIVKGIVTVPDFIKTADNAIILFDSSSSMKKVFRDTGRSRYDLARQSLKDRNAYFPDLGYNFGLYLYTPWKEVYPVQPYSREKFAKAIDALPETPKGPTLIRQALWKLDALLENLEGRTAVFIYTDGYYDKGTGGKKPATLASELAKKYNVCFYLISTADDYHSNELFRKAGEFNFCSRVIGFDEFVGKEIYNAEALFTVKATRKIVTVADTKVIGIKGNPFLFGFDEAGISDAEAERLSLVAEFMKQNPGAFLAMAGHTDNTGPAGYNMRLSYLRVKHIRDILVETHGISTSRIPMFWYGEDNPAADNGTAEGRARNRRVEIAMGGL